MNAIRTSQASPSVTKASVAIIGGGLSGISTAYYLAKNHGISDTVIVDALPQPMAYTTAQSGENYRNWWPHPVMTSLSNRSIDLMEEIMKTDQSISMRRRGYLLATRSRATAEGVLKQLLTTSEGSEVRVHDQGSHQATYNQSSPSFGECPASGVDVLQNKDLIQAQFPVLDPKVDTLFHIRRAGDLNSQRLGSYMLDSIRLNGGKLISNSKVKQIERDLGGFTLHVAPTSNDGCDDVGHRVVANVLVNAAGPMATTVANMVGVSLPIHNVFHQKVAFRDEAKAIPRTLPFTIDLDPQHINWSDEDRLALSEDESLQWLVKELQGSVHCRPDGGDRGNWVKLGWAFNRTPSEPSFDYSQLLDSYFREIVVRAASRLIPALSVYQESGLPRNHHHHYGGWYSMTPENWPLVGPMDSGHEGLPPAFMNCAPSGFGSMMACATGELCSAWVANGPLPDYASPLSMDRYEDASAMEQLLKSDKGLL